MNDIKIIPFKHTIRCVLLTDKKEFMVVEDKYGIPQGTRIQYFDVLIHGVQIGIYQWVEKRMIGLVSPSGIPWQLYDPRQVDLPEWLRQTISKSNDEGKFHRFLEKNNKKFVDMLDFLNYSKQRIRVDYLTLKDLQALRQEDGTLAFFLLLGSLALVWNYSR